MRTESTNGDVEIDRLGSLAAFDLIGDANEIEFNRNFSRTRSNIPVPVRPAVFDTLSDLFDMSHPTNGASPADRERASRGIALFRVKNS